MKRTATIEITISADNEVTWRKYIGVCKKKKSPQVVLAGRAEVVYSGEWLIN